VTTQVSRRSVFDVNTSGIAFVVVLTIATEALARKGLLTSYFPTPSVVLAALSAGLMNGEISSQLGITLGVYAESLALATALAVIVGILMGTFATVRDALIVLVEMLRPIPSVALIPLAILFFGLGVTMRTTLIVYAAFWPMLVNTYYGVRGIDPLAIDTAKNFGITPAQTLWSVTLPSALVNIATGFRISASLALVVTITAELIAGNSGIGFYIAQMEQANRIPEMYAGIFLAGLLGFSINALVMRVERRVIFWSASARREQT
jgi:NitT/TauT family transport system permease protein